jgi:hypothetical protein
MDILGLAAGKKCTKKGKKKDHAKAWSSEAELSGFA